MCIVEGIGALESIFILLNDISYQQKILFFKRNNLIREYYDQADKLKVLKIKIELNNIYLDGKKDSLKKLISNFEKRKSLLEEIMKRLDHLIERRKLIPSNYLNCQQILEENIKKNQLKKEEYKNIFEKFSLKKEEKQVKLEEEIKKVSFEIDQMKIRCEEISKIKHKFLQRIGETLTQSRELHDSEKELIVQLKRYYQ